MLKISPVFWWSIVLKRGLRTPPALRRSQQEIKRWSFWIHAPNSPLNLSQQLFTYIAATQWRSVLPRLVFPDLEKPLGPSQTTSQQAGNHYHWSSFLDLRSKVFVHGHTREWSLQWQHYGLWHREHQVKPVVAFSFWTTLRQQPSADNLWMAFFKVHKAICFLTADTKNEKGNKATFKSSPPAWRCLHWDQEHRSSDDMQRATAPHFTETLTWQQWP